LSIILLPLAFSSCEDNEIVEEVTGNVDLIVDGQTISISPAIFSILNGRVTMTASNGNYSVVMYVDASSAGEYKLGICKDLTLAELTSAISGVTELATGGGNYFAFSPSNNVQANAKIIIVGKVNFSTLNSNRIEGTFSGTAIDKSELETLINGDLMNIVNLLIGGDGTLISGTFKANKVPVK